MKKENDVKGYWIILGTKVTDTDAQAKYGALWAPIAEKYQARLIASGSSLDLREEKGTERMVLVEFPSFTMAKACYDDPDYQHAKDFARAASNRDLILFEGDIR